METKLETLTDCCKGFISDYLPDYSGTNVYGCDLAYTITDGINLDGSFTYSTYKAKEYLKFWWDDAANYFQYEKDNFGQNLHNPFENPEAYMVCMVIEGVNSLLSKSKFIDKNWDNSIELTDKNIEKIILEIKCFEVEF